MNWFRTVAALILLGFLCGCGQAVILTVTAVDDTSGSPIYGAKIYIDGRYEGETNSAGQYIYEHNLRTSFRIGLEKPGYVPWQALLSQTQTSIRAGLSRQTSALTVTVYDADSLKPVSGALVKVTGSAGVIQTVSTGTGGVAQFAATAGSIYNVEISATNYDTLYKTVEMENVGKAVDYRLFRNDIFIVEVEEKDLGVPLSGANVHIDGIFFGTTGTDGKATSFVERERSHTIRITTDDYLAYTDEVYIASDMLLYRAKLSKTLYPVTVSVYDIKKMPVGKATVFIDAKNTGTTNEYGRIGIVYLDAGLHEVKAVKDGFNTFTKSVTADDSLQDVIIELDYADTLVTITVHDKEGNPIGGASVSVNDNYNGVTKADGTLATPLQSNENYRISVRNAGYTPAEITQDIPLGATEMAVDIEMNKELNLIYFVVIVGAILVVAVLYLKRGTVSLKRRGKRPPKSRSL